MKARFVRQSTPAERLDMVFARDPVNRVAMRVTQQDLMDHPQNDPQPPPEPEYIPRSFHFCSFERPALMKLNGLDITTMRRQGTDQLLRRKIGKLTVIGVAAERKPVSAGGDKAHRRRWVVQCECGRYEYRQTPALRRNDDRGCCDYCRWVAEGKPRRKPSLPSKPVRDTYQPDRHGFTLGEIARRR
ncbi:MAG: hypothetical protein J2P48_08320 [Alphaproteobacteria bacterium]|nr:hypothetical protein [Alphaproteobacteria bacterium]